MMLREVMSHPAITVTGRTPVADAAEILVRAGFTALPVLHDDDDALIGIVTEADLIRGRIAPDARLRRLIGGQDRPASSVADVMSTSVESLAPVADAAEAARIMDLKRIRCIPVVDAGKVVGVVTRRDLLRANAVRPDHDVLSDIGQHLSSLDEPGRWVITIRRGVVDIEDRNSDPDQRELARRVATAVPGVVSATVRHRSPDLT